MKLNTTLSNRQNDTVVQRKDITKIIFEVVHKKKTNKKNRSFKTPLDGHALNMISNQITWDLENDNVP